MKKVLIIAGESSGDLHAAELIKATLIKNSDLYFLGIGGDKMRAAGANIIMDNKELAVVGIFEVLTHFKVIKTAFKMIKSILNNSPPDLLILVDYPGFNLRIAKVAKKLNIKVLYFISPQLWAWKQGRIKIMKNCVNKIAVIFPFEVEFYRKHNVNACYVGNPLLQQVRPNLSKTEAYELFNLDPNKPIVALLPGSRKSELKLIFETILETAVKIKNKFPSVQFIIPIANHFSPEQLQPAITHHQLDVKIIPNQLYNLLQITDAALCVSGTVTLEVALMGVPFAILYKINALSYCIGRILIKIDTFGLCNIVSRKKIAKEFIQHDANAETLSTEIIKLLEDKNYRNIQINDFKNLRNEFDSYPAEDIGSVVVELIQA